MRNLLFTALYLASAAGSSAAADLASLRAGDMQKLVFHEAPVAVSEAAFVTEDGGEAHLSDYRGQIVLLNFWATWCAPCRAEMPMLSDLQAEFGGDDFQVLTLATGRNTASGIDRFFEETGINNLPKHTDPKSAVARDMNVLGLPITVLLDREGREIARLRGDAEWNSDSARAIIAAAIKG